MITAHTKDVLDAIFRERERQDARFGEQNHPLVSTSGQRSAANFVDYARKCCDEDAVAGTLTWQVILNEELYEALAETDPTKRREELVQLAAVVVAAIESEDRAAAAAAAAALTAETEAAGLYPVGNTEACS